MSIIIPLYLYIYTCPTLFNAKVNLVWLSNGNDHKPHIHIFYTIHKLTRRKIIHAIGANKSTSYKYISIPTTSMLLLVDDQPEGRIGAKGVMGGCGCDVIWFVARIPYRRFPRDDLIVFAAKTKTAFCSHISQ